MITTQRRRKRKIVWIVLRWLEKYHKKSSVHDVPFDLLLAEIRKYFPNTKFSPAHLAWYKHHFLKGDLEFLYDANSPFGVER